MELPFYIAWISMIHLTVFSIILFFKKSNQKSNRVLGLYMLPYAYLHLTHLLFISNTVARYHFFNELGFFLLYLQGPLYLLYISYMTGYSIPWKKQAVWHLIPLIVPAWFVLNGSLKTQDEIALYYKNTMEGGQPLDATIVLSILIIQLAVYLIWSIRLLNRHIRERNSESYTADLTWLRSVTIMFMVITFVIGPALIVLSNGSTSILLIYMPIITMIMYVILIYRAVNFPSAELEKSMIQQQIREKISKDMHDDLGSGLSKIAIMSEVLKLRMKDEKDISQIGKIADTAGELVDSMGQIVWAMNPENDTIENLFAYIRKFGFDFFEESGITCTTIFSDERQDIHLSQVIRRNVFLVIKESFHNILKHAGATAVQINIRLEKRLLMIVISDNGKGFDLNSENSFGNGLKNMKKRMEHIGGTYEISSEPAAGTTTRIGIAV